MNLQKVVAMSAMNKQQAIIVDLDGTLANCEHRRHFVTGEKKDWKSFYERMGEDTVNEWCEFIIDKCCYNEYGFIEKSILLVSGRPEEYRDLTLDWLNKNALAPFNINIYMRKTGDYRDDVIIKEEIYREHIEPNYNVLFAIDDRAKVAALWRRLGIVCLHCAQGDF